MKIFKKVIDNKSAEWLEDRYWSRYLRPQTLFGPKFEMYLNQSMYKSELREEDFNFDDGAIKFLFMGKMDVKHA